MALEGLSRGIFRSIGLLKSKRKLDDEELREMTRSLRRALQEADFNVRQTKEIVERMESTDVDIDKMIENYQSGLSLLKFCQKKIQEAEFKLTELNAVDLEQN